MIAPIQGIWRLRSSQTTPSTRYQSNAWPCSSRRLTS